MLRDEIALKKQKYTLLTIKCFFLYLQLTNI